ncbi:MAG: hypothetical protein MJ158_01840 [Alphaproteobacteria bacterium]|nr:hypothetical protein [Alphaproteobacteria bacterium]
MFKKILNLLHRNNIQKTHNIKQNDNMKVSKYVIKLPLEYNLSESNKYINILCTLCSNTTSQNIKKTELLTLPADDTINKYINYLNTINQINPDILNREFVRTIYIVDLAPDKQIYILPPIPSITKHRAIIGNINHTTKQDWFLYTSQKTNAVIARCLKTYPKSR